MGDYSVKLGVQFNKDGHHAIPVTRLPNGLWYLPNDPYSMANTLKITLRGAMKTYEKGILFWQYTPQNFSSIALPFWLPFTVFALKKKGWKQAIFFHEVSVRFWGYGLKQGLQAIGHRVIANLLSAICAKTFTSIHLYRSYFWGKKPAVIPVGANILPDTSPHKTTSKTYEMACFTNRVDDALFAAVAGINTKQVCRLVLLGHCTEKQHKDIENYQRQYHLTNLITLTGAISETELSGHLQSAKIFVQPQMVQRKNQGGASAKNGTILAAMAHGLPIITTEGDMTDQHIFINQQNMVFVSYGNEQAYQTEIERLLAEPETAEQLGARAKKDYDEKMDWPVIAKKITEAIF